MAASGINRLRSVMNDFTLYGEQKKPEENDEEKDVLARLANAKRNNVAATATTEEQDVLARLRRAMSDNVASAAPQPPTDRSTPNQSARVTQSHGERFERQETEAALKKQTSGSAIKLPDGLSEIAKTKQTPAQAAVSAADLESRLGQYSATMNDTERNMGALLPGLDYAKSAVDSAQTEWGKYERKLTLLDEQLKNKNLSAKEYNNLVNEYNALLPYAQQAAKRLDSEISTYNSLSGQAQQMQAQYNDALLQYQQALPEYNALSSRGKIDAEALKREGDKLVAEVKELDRLANDRDELRVNRGMTPEEVGAWQQETFNLRTEIQEKTERARELYNQSDAAQKRYGQYQYNQLLANAENFNDPNWKKLSATNKDMMGGEAKYENGVVNYGKQDIDYAIINGDADTLNVWNGNNPIAVSKSYLTQMTDRERAAYNYLYAKKGKDAADAFLEELTPELNARQRGENQKKWGAYAEEDPWGTSAFSVLVSPAKAVSFFGQALDLIADGKIDQNAAYNQYSQIPSDIRGTVSKIAEEKWGKEGSFGYQTAMSMADFLFNSLITGEFFGAGSDLSGLASMFRPSLLIMGTGAAADTVIDLRDKGLDSTRAFVLGAAAGLAEMITEKYSLETMLSPELWADGLVKYWLKNMVAEGSEEVASTVLNWTADFLYDLVSGQNENEWQRDIRANIKNGMSARDATMAVVQDRIEGLAADALGGAISGGVMAGIGGGYHTLMNTNVAKAAQATVADLKESRAPMEAAPAPMESAPVEAPIQEATPRTALEAAVDKLQAGEQLTQNDAKRILNDPASVQALQEAGVMTGTIHNDSEGRQLVRQLVEQYAATEANNRVAEANIAQEAPQAAQETQEEQAADIPPAEEAPRTEGLRLPTAQETLTPAPQKVNLLAQNRTEVNDNGTQTPAPAPEAGTVRNAPAEQSFAKRARAAAETERSRAILDRSERRTSLGRFLQNYREIRAQQRADQQFASQKQRAAQLQHQADARNLTYTSAVELGVTGGTEKSTMQVIPQDMLDRDQLAAKQAAARDGVDLQFVLGQGEALDDNGAAYNFRGWISADGKRMIVQADHNKLTWQQILSHEELHKLIKSDSEYRRTVENALLADKKLQPYLGGIVDRYVAAYHDMQVYDENEIIEEMLADYRAGFDMLDIYHGAAGNVAAKKAAAKDIRAAERGRAAQGRSTESGQENFSREVDLTFQREFTGEVRSAKGIRINSREYNAIKHALKSGYGQLDSDGLGGTVNTENYCYSFDAFSDGSIEVFKRVRNDRMNIHNAETGGEYGSKQRDDTPSRKTEQRSGNGSNNRAQRLDHDGRGSGYAETDSVDRSKRSDGGSNSEESQGDRAPVKRADGSFSRELDSDGSKLSAQQQEYFKDSKVRDGAGRLQVVYHGTPKGGFNEFAVTDDIGYFFTDSLRMAQTYSGGGDIYAPERIETWDQAKALAKEYDMELEWDEEDETWYLTDDWYGRTDMGENATPRDIAEEINSRNGDSGERMAYEVYLNIKDPLIINGHGQNWDNISDAAKNHVLEAEYTDEGNINLKVMEQGSYDTVIDTEVSDFDGVLAELQYLYGEGDAANTLTEEIQESLETGGHYDNYEVSVDDDGYFAYGQSTRDWVREAQDMGCDGVIFYDISDVGKYGYGTESGNVYVVFDSNQVKSTRNANPTKDPDIRYSREIDPAESARAEARALQPTAPGSYTGGPRGRGRSTNPRKKVSRVRTRAFELGGLYNEVETQMAETQPEEFTYDPVSEKRGMNEALGRLKKDFAGEAEKLASSDQWGGSDLDTAMGILYQYRQIGRETGDYSLFNDWSHVIQQKGTKGGQFVQAFAKYSRTATGVAQKAAENLRDQHALTPAQQKRVEGHVNELMRAVDDFAEEAARGSVEDARGAKKGLKLRSVKQQYGDTQKAKDAMNVVKEIYDIFSKKTRRDHGAPVDDWTKLTGDQLASRIASRFNSTSNKQRTTMQTILDDLLTYASEHALPKREGKAPRTATERITDYLNNREAYGTAWSEAKQVLREMYANDQEKLDALEAFLNSTISYNGGDLDQTMFRAILESADALGLTKQDILKLTAAGVNEGTIDRITEEFLRQTGSDDANLRDTVARHITNLVMADNQEGRLGRMENEAAKELDLKLQNLLRESKQTKSSAANAIAQYLINDLGISGTDAAIAADHIASHYMERIEAKAAQTLEKMFAEKGERVKPQQRDRLLDLIHLGGLTNANVEDAVVDALGIGKLSRAQQRQIMDAMAQFADTLDAIENDDLEGLRQLIRLQAAARRTKLSSLAEEILSGETDAEYLRNFATTQLGLIAADYDARSAGEKISTLQVISHLLNARTAMRNVTSNQVFDIVDSTANNVGLLPDLIMSKITGQRTVGLEKSWFSQAKRQGAMKGMGRNILEVALDVDPEGRNKSKYGTGGRRTFSMANSGTVGRILSKAEEIMGYELNTTDEFHKGSVYAETLESLGRFVDAGYMTEEEAAEFAAQEALYRSFQDDTKVGAMLAGLKDVLNIIGTGKTNGKTIRGLPVHDFGLGDLVVKYTQVPGALIHRAIEYSPVGYLKAIYNIAQLANAKTKGESTIKQQRNAALSLGRATTGSGLIMAFTLLAKLGLLRRGDDEKDKNAATLKNSQGLSGTQLNVSALGRLLGGEAPELREGDILYDIGFLEPLDSLMTIAALINNDPEIKNLNLYEMFRSAETAKELVGKSLQGIWLALEDTSAMQTLSNIYSTIRYHDEENDLPLYMQIPMEIASSSVSGFIPAPIRQLAQATDTTYRDQYRSRDLLAQTGARVANAIPGLRKQLAPKLTPLGEDKTYQEPWLNALNALVNPGNVSVYQTDKVRDELLRVYEETGDGSMLPARNAPYSISIGGESYTLTPDERTEYQRIRGQAETEFVKDLQTAYWYREADADTQASFLNSARNIANDIAKVQWAAERGIKYHDTEYREYLKMLDNGDSYANVIREANEKLADMVWAGIPRPVWDNAKADFDDIANSDISSYEKGVQQRALISDLDLDDEQKLTLYGDLANADSRIEQFRTVMDTGLSFNETAKIFDKYSEFKSEDDTRAAQDAKDFALWVDQQKDLTEKQRKVIKEQFKYWTMIPAEAKLYEKYVGMGYEPEVASRIDSALSGLQPLPGNDGVTDMQRAQAALGALGKNASQSDQMKIVESFYGGKTTNKDGSLSQWGQIKKVTGSGVTVEKTLKMIEDGTLSPYCKWMDSDSKKKGIQSSTYVSYEKKYNSTNSDRDENGKEIKGKTRKDKMMAYIDGLKDLSIEQKDALFLEHYAESTLKDTPWHKGGGSGKGKTYAPAKLRLPTTAERRAPIQQNKLRLK